MSTTHTLFFKPYILCISPILSLMLILQESFPKLTYIDTQAQLFLNDS